MKRALALICLSMLSACVDAPPTEPQSTEIPPAALGLGAASAPAVSADWWKQFGDPQFERLAAQMLADNPSLRAALARVRAAEAGLSAERASAFPQAALTGQATREGFSSNYIVPPPFGGSTQWVGQLHAGLNWSLDFWGKQAALIERAGAVSSAAMFDAQAARLALTGAFAQTYIGLMLAHQNGDIARQAVAEREKILELTEGRFWSGLEDASAVEQARAQLSLARLEVMRLEAQRDMLVHAVAALTGQGASAYATISRPVLKLDAVLTLPDNLPADLLARRPDIMAARARVEAALQGRVAANAAFYPNINLTAFAGFSAIGLSNMFTGSAFDYGVGPALQLPIFDAGKIRAQYSAATASLDGAVEEYNGAVLSAVRETADALTLVRNLEGQRSEQAAALESATRAFDFAHSRYSSGMSSQIVVLNAESLLLVARQQMASLQAQVAIQRITLMLAAGGAVNPN